MKFIGIVGSISKESYNKKLMDYTKFIFNDLVDIDIVDLKGIPIFNEDIADVNHPLAAEISKKIDNSDGVIIATPEINYSMPPILKNLIEWLSFNLHPFRQKPVMIIGASYNNQGTARAQMHLKQVLNAKGVDAFVIPGHEFLLTNAKDKFDEDGMIIDEETNDYLEHNLMRFMEYAKLINSLDLDNINSRLNLTLKAGGYVNIDDPDADGTAGASEY